MSKYMIQLTFFLTVFVLSPLNLYCNNILELSDELDVMAQISVLAGIFIILMLILNKFLSEKAKSIMNFVLLFLTILIFIQGNFIHYNLGVMDGWTPIDWEYYRFALFFETVFWLIFLFVFIKFRYKLISNFKKICALLLTIQALTLLYNIFNLYTTDMFNSKKKLIVSEQKRKEDIKNNAYTFSKNKNILIWVIDACPSTILDEIFESEEGEHFKEVFKDFTYYDKAISRFPTTIMSVSNIQSGIPYDNSVTMDEFKEINKKYFIESKLPEYKYINNKEPYSKIADNLFIGALLLKHSPILIKYILSNNPINLCNAKRNYHYDIHYYNNLKQSINFTDEPIYKYVHLVGAHGGFKMNKDITFNPNASLNDTVIGELKILEFLLSELKKQCVYDNSMIFIIADHGRQFLFNYKKYSRPIFLFKNFDTKQEKLIVKHDTVQLGDIPNTIFDVLNKPLNPYGLPITKNIPEDRLVEHCNYNWTKTIREENLAKNYLPPITCKMFKHGVNYDESKNIINSNHHEFVKQDLNAVVSSEYFYYKFEDDIWTDKNTYLEFKLDKNIKPKEYIDVTIKTNIKKSKLKTIEIQDDKTKNIITVLKYPEKKPMTFSFQVPLTAIKDDGTIKLNLIQHDVKQIHELKTLGFAIQSIIIDIK